MRTAALPPQTWRLPSLFLPLSLSERGYTDKGGQLLPVDLADLGDQGQEGVTEHRPGSFEGLDQAVFGSEVRIAGNDLCQALADQQALGVDALQPLADHAPKCWITHLLELIAEADLVLGQLEFAAQRPVRPSARR